MRKETMARKPEWLVLVLLAIAPAAHACDVAGRVDGLLVDKVKLTRIDATRMSIARGDQTLAIEDGMPVCQDDVINAGAGVVAIVRVGNDAAKDNAITLFGEAAITVDNPNGITARLGRIFALLRDKFDVRTNFGTLGARGTQFEVNATATEARVVQLEGAVALEKSAAPTEQLVQPLFETTLSAGAATEPKGVSREGCAGILATHSGIVSTTRPELPFEASGRSASKQEIANDFASAREAILCDHQAGLAGQLAKAWANYAEPGGVFKLAAKFPPTPDRSDAAIYMNNLGNAYRQAGQSSDALIWYQRALEADHNFAFPYNGSGDAHRDLGLAALAARDLATAGKEFEVAQQSYLRSLDEGLWGKSGGANRAIPMVNLGELAILRIALDPEQSAQRIASAEQWFQQALKLTGGSFAFAELGLARLDLMRALAVPNIQVVADDEMKRIKAQGLADILTSLAQSPYINSARKRLDTLAKKYPEFSAGALLRGEFSALFGSPKDAVQEFREAVRFDPHNVTAYLRLSTAAKASKQEQAMYQAAFRSAAFPAQVPVIQGHVIALDTSRPAADVRDVRALSSSTSTVTFGFGHEPQAQSITFTNVGSAAVTVGNISITGEDAAEFGVQGDGCANHQLAPGANCSISVQFKGDHSIARSARLEVGSSGGVDAHVALKALKREAPGIL